MKFTLPLLLALYCLQFVPPQKSIDYVELKVGCLVIGDVPKQAVLRTNEEYREFFDHRSSHPDCTSYVPPAVDFKTHMVLSFRVSSGGCGEPEYEKNIFVRNDTIIFNVKSAEHGFCKTLNQKLFIVAIPKDNSPIRFTKEIIQ